MAASAHFLSLAPQTLSLHHSNSSLAPSLFAPSSFKPLPKLALALSSITSRSNPASKFVRYVAFSSDLDEGTGADAEFSPEVKLFVGNLPFTVDSAALAELFEEGGRSVEQVEVIYDKATGRSRGFGFVVMSSVEEAEAAAQQFDGYELEGRPLRVNSGPPPPKRENSFFGGSRGRENSSFGGPRGRENSSFGGPRGRENYSFGGPRGRENYSFGGSRGPSSGSTNKLYVGNLSWDVDNLTLESVFSKHGNVREARVVYDRESGRSRGFGFVTYNSAEEVNSAIKGLDGADLDGRPIRVNPAEDRR